MKDVNVVDRKYPVRNLRPAKGFKTKELGLIWAALRSCGYAPYVHPTTTYHLSTMTPVIARSIYGVEEDLENVIHTMVKNSFKALRRILKKPGRRLILPGRDVWLWSVMCHKMGIDHVFDARISRGVARDHKVLAKIIQPWHLNQNTIIFDTGFAGSIYNHICAASRKTPINLMLSTHRLAPNGKSEQLFPNHKGARAKALAIEYLPKYQKTGTIRGDKPVQWLGTLDEFIRAAILTIWFWHYESPAWIARGDRKCKVVDCYCKSCALWKEAPMPTV